GVTTFFLQHQIDTGNIIFQEKTQINEDENFESLYKKLMDLGAGLVLKTVNAIENNDCPSIPQEEIHDLRQAPKIMKETCKINWETPAWQIVNFVRGLSPYPAAWTELNGKSFKIFKTSSEPASLEHKPGTLLTDEKTFLKVQTSEGL